MCREGLVKLPITRKPKLDPANFGMVTRECSKSWCLQEATNCCNLLRLKANSNESAAVKNLLQRSSTAKDS